MWQLTALPSSTPKTINNNTTKTVFRHFVTNLKSRSIRRAFFDRQGLFSASSGKLEQQTNIPPDMQQDRRFESFNKRLTISFEKTDRPLRANRRQPKLTTISLSYRGKDKNKLHDTLNEFAVFVQQRTVDELTAGAIAIIQTKIEKTKAQIAAKRMSAKQRLQNRIIILSEALAIAKQLQIEEQQTAWQQPDKTNISFYMKPITTYARGSKALAAEIASLKQRQSLDPFINGLTGLQEKLQLLEAKLLFDRDKIEVATIEQAAKAPSRPIKTKHKNYIIIAFILGLFLSLFVVHLLNALDRAKVSVSRQSP